MTVIESANAVSEPGSAMGQGVAAAIPSGVGRLRVVIATFERLEGHTGVHTHTRLLNAGIASRQHACMVLNPFSGAAIWKAIFAVRPLLLKKRHLNWSSRWYRYWHFRALRANLIRHLSREGADAVIAQCPLSALAALEARAVVGGRFKVITVCHFNAGEARELKAKGELTDEGTFQAIEAMEGEVWRRCDHVVYVSGWARRMVEESRGLRPRSASVIWNGVPHLSERAPADRELLGLKGQELVLINIGSLEPRKNQLGLLDLFSQIAGRHPGVKLLLVGEGPGRMDIERKIARLGLSESVRLLGSRSDVPALLAASDVYVHFASLENCPMALLEAARAGLPAAAIPAGGIPEVQQELQNGVDLNADDMNISFHAILPLLENSALRAALGQAGVVNFQRCFTADVMVSHFLDTIHYLLTDSHTGVAITSRP